MLGIDPGYGRLGWSVIEKNLNLVDYGTIETASGCNIADRIHTIHTKLETIINLYRPDCAAIERLFFSKNTTTAIDVAKTIGAVVLTLRLHDIEHTEYTPSQIKQSLTGYGRAGKEQMKFMIKSIFKLTEIPQPDDAADAIAIALCHSLRCGS
ncbi:MAG: crossover junction endodeoxyribonuclease RuvC [Chrysiogenales bacterium]|nr:MAG: crossover junction endodeoxyribonuclease RuvC [Chrysiogenales bacterium]